MNLIDEIKMLLFLKNLVRRLQMLNKLKATLGGLDGMKSVLGLLMVVSYYALPTYAGVKVPDFVLKTGTSLAAVGLVHKIEKGTGIVSKGLDVLKAALAALDKPA